MTFYTYLYLREDGTPYYVGKGKDNRAWHHMHRDTKPPKDRSRILLQEHPSEQDAFAAEIFLIEYYGRKDLGTGILRNRTNGGEGTSGHLCSEVHRQRLSTSHIGKAGNFKGKRHSKKSRRKISLGHTGMKYSSETRQKMSESASRAWLLRKDKNL